MNKEQTKEYKRKWYHEHKKEMQEYHKKWLASHKEQTRKTGREYRRKNRDRVLEWKRNWAKENPEKERLMDANYYYRRTYGISFYDFLELVKERNNLCDICKTPMTKSKHEPCYDHDHDTGKFRGLLCARCNQTLGKVEDNPLLLSKMITYLAIPRGTD